MPYLAVIVPEVPQDRKDKLLAAWPTISKEMTALPQVLGVSGGVIVGEDGAPVTSFKWLQTTTFLTLEDEKAFAASEWVKEQKANLESQLAAPPPMALFEVAEFPEDRTRKPFLQFSRIELGDGSKHEEARKAWEDLMGVLAKQAWGGKKVGDGDFIGLGIVGWDSLEEAGAAYKEPKAAAAYAHYKSLGSCKDVMVKLEL